jgi:electron transport complex protein RnfD
MGQPITIRDMYAAVTGTLLAFNLPVTIPLWMAAIGCAAAILVVKQMFGGIGKNFANPAIVGRIVLLVSFASQMTNWVKPLLGFGFVDTVTSATPLGIASVDAVTNATSLASGLPAIPSYLNLFLGAVGGSLGETCKLTLLLGGIYLVIRRVISVTIPLSFMGTVFLFTLVLGKDPVYHLLSGGLILGAIFMATDYVTTPTTERGKVIFGVGCGFITVIIRVFAANPEGVSFAILLMNILTPHIDNLCRIKAFGGAKA